MNTVLEILAIFFLLVSSVFLVVSGIGIVRLPDLYMRLHAPAKASTLGLGCALLASITLSLSLGRFGMAEVLITLLTFITAPVSANLMAQAAIHLKLRSKSGEVPEAINRRLPWQRPKEPADQEK